MGSAEAGRCCRPRDNEHLWPPPLARDACTALSNGYETFIEPMRELAPRTWAILYRYCSEAYLIESLDKHEEFGLRPGTIYPVFPVPAGFCSFGLYFGTRADPLGDESHLVEFERKVARLPDGFKKIVQHFERIYINSKSDTLEFPDVIGLEPVAYVGATIDELVKGSSKKALWERLGDLVDFCIIAKQRESNTGCLFFDNSKNGDGSIWVSFDSKFSDIRKLVHPEQAYDAMLEHYLLGLDVEFDFSAYCEN